MSVVNYKNQVSSRKEVTYLRHRESDLFFNALSLSNLCVIFLCVHVCFYVGVFVCAKPKPKSKMHFCAKWKKKYFNSALFTKKLWIIGDININLITKEIWTCYPVFWCWPSYVCTLCDVKILSIDHQNKAKLTKIIF